VEEEDEDEEDEEWYVTGILFSSFSVWVCVACDNETDIGQVERIND
jgi:hypothetical protein